LACWKQRKSNNVTFQKNATLFDFDGGKQPKFRSPLRFCACKWIANKGRFPSHGFCEAETGHVHDARERADRFGDIPEKSTDVTIFWKVTMIGSLGCKVDVERQRVPFSTIRVIAALNGRGAGLAET
jgi:hypothetical protein